KLGSYGSPVLKLVAGRWLARRPLLRAHRYQLPTTHYQLETYRHTAEHPLWRTKHKQLVVNGRLGPVLLEEIAHRHEHLPLRVAEIQKRQRLIDLHVEPRDGAGHGAGRRRVVKRRIQLVEHEQPRRGRSDDAFDGRGHVVNAV